MQRPWFVVVCILVLVLPMVGCDAGQVKERIGQSAATRVLGQVQTQVAKLQTNEPEAEASSDEEETPTARPRATGGAVPPSGGGAESGGCLDGFPRYPGVKDSPDAQSLTRILMANELFKESRGYSSADPVAKVIAFYQQRPADAGWESSPIQEQVQEDGATLWWAKDGATVLLMLTQEQGKPTLIAIVCQPPEG